MSDDEVRFVPFITISNCIFKVVGLMNTYISIPYTTGFVKAAGMISTIIKHKRPGVLHFVCNYNKGNTVLNECSDPALKHKLRLQEYYLPCLHFLTQLFNS